MEVLAYEQVGFKTHRLWGHRLLPVHRFLHGCLFLWPGLRYHAHLHK